MSELCFYNTQKWPSNFLQPPWSTCSFSACLSCALTSKRYIRPWCISIPSWISWRHEWEQNTVSVQTCCLGMVHFLALSFPEYDVRVGWNEFNLEEGFFFCNHSRNDLDDSVIIHSKFLTDERMPLSITFRPHSGTNRDRETCLNLVN